MLVKDQLNRTHNFKLPPQRIVSLVPSQTELLVDLGLGDQIVGVTKFCVHPTSLRKEKVIVGGTKSVSIEKIKALSPDIIICNKEENTKEIVESLEPIAPVWISDILTMQDVFNLIESIGEIFAISDKAFTLNQKLKQTHTNFITWSLQQPSKKVAYLIWKNPYMIAGNQTFINTLLTQNNFKNIGEELPGRYPEVSLELLRDDVDIILLATEPYPFKEIDCTELKSQLNKNVILVDGEYFSWYGSRLLDAYSYFKSILRA